MFVQLEPLTSGGRELVSLLSHMIILSSLQYFSFCHAHQHLPLQDRRDSPWTGTPRMADTPSSALTKRAADTALMPPPPPPKRQKRPKNVLDEDVYADALSHIIARDFFPGLLETEAQQEYMQALDSNNSDWIRDAGRRLTQVMTPGPSSRRRGTSFTPRRSSAGETPRGYVGETPGRTPAAGGGSADDFAAEKPDVDVNLSLAAFQAKYTSEDNESFNDLLDKQNERRQGKYDFFHHGNKIPSTRQIAHRHSEQKLLQGSGGDNTTMALVRMNAGGEERKLVAGGGPSQDLDARPASVDSFPGRQGARNSFMFGPDSVEDSALTRAQDLQNRSNAPPRSVTYGATRFQKTSSNAEDTVPPSPSMSAIDAAIAGRPRATDSEPGYSGAETPRVNGYAFVDAEPTPSEFGVPVSDEEADRAEREAVMKLLPRADESGPNPFTIHQRSGREDLHHRLVERADTQRRKEKGGIGSRLSQLRDLGVTPRDSRTASPRTGGAPKDKSGMTPAAQRLAEKLRTPKAGRGGDGSMFGGRGGKADWTPTPRVNRPT